MSTHDVPGYNAANKDILAMGCWAEHEDGSLILVESCEGDRVIYSVFDVSKNPPMEYRDAMPEDGFKKHFSWNPDDSSDDNMKWEWHDKTAFPWDKVIEGGIPDGVRHASASHLLSAAEKISEKRNIIGKPVEKEEVDHMQDKEGKFGRAARAIVDGLQNALDELKV